MQHKHIIKSLPLLASVLGRRYGVEVRIGGDDACTNGSIIQLPSLPLDADEILLGLVRGYIDHESAHARATDFKALQKAGLSPLEKHIWNILEDWRVENRLVEFFPGCRENFQWLIKHLFLPPSPGDSPNDTPDAAAAHILNWLLISVRSWDVPELTDERDRLRQLVEKHFPGLLRELDPLLSQVPKRCKSTVDAIGLAREIGGRIERYAQLQEQKNEKGSNEQAVRTGEPGVFRPSSEALQALRQLLASGTEFKADDTSERVREHLVTACNASGERLQVAVPTGTRTRALSEEEIQRARTATTALRTRLQALLQSTRAVKNRSGYAGSLDKRKLHSVMTGNAKVFLRKGERVAVNTAVHILLDASGSMSGNAIDLAGQACFAAASALHAIPGVSVGVTAFPGEPLGGVSNNGTSWQTVAPILGHGRPLHSCFGINAAGCTPLDSALLWATLLFLQRPEPRKLIFIITDGKPDRESAALAATKVAQDNGLELFGIGIVCPDIQHLLNAQRCRVISGISELAPAMFGMLQHALLGR